MTKTVFLTDPATGEYLGPVILDASDLSPREPGVYLTPANCTEAAPPEAPAGSIAIRKGGAWEVIEDHRGEVVYVDGIAMRIADFGALPEDATTEPPPPPEPTEANLWAALRSHRDTLLTACDWTQLTDSPLSDEARMAWALYRQTLRDLPAQTRDPAVPEWPGTPL